MSRVWTYMSLHHKRNYTTTYLITQQRTATNAATILQLSTQVLMVGSRPVTAGMAPGITSLSLRLCVFLCVCSCVILCVSVRLCVCVSVCP